LFGAFDRQQIKWCVLRGEADLLAPADDVDVLVAPGDLPRMRWVARGLGFARVPAWGYGSHTFLLTYDATSDFWIKLDVVTELAFGPLFSLATGAEAGCLTRRQYVGGIPLLADSDAFWALLLHVLLDKRGAAKARDATRLAELAPSADKAGSLARLVDSACPVGWSAHRILVEVRRGDWTTLTHFAPRLAAGWSQQRRTWVRRRMIFGRFWRWSGKWLVLSRRRGLGVALLGPDGSGKSTLTAGIEKSFYFPVRSMYMGPYQDSSRQLATLGIPGLGLAHRISGQWARWLKAAYQQRRGRLFLFDRYSYDALLPARRGQSGRIRAHRWLLAHSCPPPDLVVLLDAPGELLYARKGELSVALLEREREAYCALLPRLRRPFVVDASRDAERVRKEVTGIIWHEYARRWSRRERMDSGGQMQLAEKTETCGS
jgi:thymidylate kinase